MSGASGRGGETSRLAVEGLMYYTVWLVLVLMFTSVTTYAALAHSEHSDDAGDDNGGKNNAGNNFGVTGGRSEAVRSQNGVNDNENQEENSAPRVDLDNSAVTWHLCSLFRVSGCHEDDDKPPVTARSGVTKTSESYQGDHHKIITDQDKSEIIRTSFLPPSARQRPPSPSLPPDLHVDARDRRRNYLDDSQDGPRVHISQQTRVKAPLYEDQQRVVRSADNNISSAEPVRIRPSNCIIGPSCSTRPTPSPYDEAWYPCECDDQCHVYGDCCHDTRTPTHLATPPTITPTSFACKNLFPVAQRSWVQERLVYMVVRCPERTSGHLAAKCVGTSSPDYLLDIPVVSNSSGIVYNNIFCAACHHDTPVEKFSMKILCLEPETSLAQLANMTYHPGELWWSSENILHGEKNDSQSLKWCVLDVDYPDSVGRSCKNIVDTCATNWSAKEVWWRCSSYNYYVNVNSNRYKNWDCAVCNEESEENILCLFPLYTVSLRNNNNDFVPSLTELFIVYGNCDDNQVWDIMHHQCQDVFCGSLFTLVDGECVRNNETMTDDGSSYLNTSCYTRDYNREFSVMFANLSVYLNHTERMYNFGEYEINNSSIRVCSPAERWTPAMNAISAALVCISLFGMFLHMIIFVALPKRRNIPSMNLFSMTVSLFIAEFIFVSFFNKNQNYTACVITGILIYYFLGASFLWMNVMSIDICRTFLSSTYKMKSRATFIQYSLYAWTVPLVGSLVAVSVDQLSSVEYVLTPQFGTHVCWFNNKWGLVAFFTLPSGLVILVNIMLYGMSVFNIYKQMKSGEFASSTVQKHRSSGEYKGGKRKEKILNPSDSSLNKNLSNNKSSEESESPRCSERIKERIQRRIQGHKKQRIRLVLYCKLALMMGLTWVFAFISIHTQSFIFEYLFIVFNGLQGAFIFIAFDCKKRVWDELLQKIAGRRILKTESSSGSHETKSTTISTSSGKGYKYRRSSRQLQERGLRYSAVSQNLRDSQISQNRDDSGV
ncbi:uncharacterized protein LOC121871089 isoform X2 [Homarus americanus]|uniref:uncharacterized protein LOC121871089 isoform X2 n=1 Tax=Homarus americanus TaxID=6706 RepID=UPI001C47D2A7|nr:uncharacterized protein LOC121871089 isoform X2 [Homarus americanus]